MALLHGIRNAAVPGPSASCHGEAGIAAKGLPALAFPVMAIRGAVSRALHARLTLHRMPVRSFDTGLHRCRVCKLTGFQVSAPEGMEGQLRGVPPGFACAAPVAAGRGSAALPATPHRAAPPGVVPDHTRGRSGTSRTKLRTGPLAPPWNHPGTPLSRPVRLARMVHAMRAQTSLQQLGVTREGARPPCQRRRPMPRFAVWYGTTPRVPCRCRGCASHPGLAGRTPNVLRFPIAGSHFSRPMRAASRPLR